jgi:hypothetical protein
MPHSGFLLTFSIRLHAYFASQIVWKLFLFLANAQWRTLKIGRKKVRLTIIIKMLFDFLT